MTKTTELPTDQKLMNMCVGILEKIAKNKVINNIQADINTTILDFLYEFNITKARLLTNKLLNL